MLFAFVICSCFRLKLEQGQKFIGLRSLSDGKKTSSSADSARGCACEVGGGGEAITQAENGPCPCINEDRDPAQGTRRHRSLHCEAGGWLRGSARARWAFCLPVCLLPPVTAVRGVSPAATSAAPAGCSRRPPD